MVNSQQIQRKIAMPEPVPATLKKRACFVKVQENIFYLVATVTNDSNIGHLGAKQVTELPKYPFWITKIYTKKECNII